ncbi:sensor domain-containing diguanylate cyclase [Candidatus Xianfuyuplasma coldseepsis]|uniref:Diguanylate cyclase n=1 Tax=Candidatus Xianfuyuplasma coldseepsis TaxID=2782163 RepID=A0A7L7KRG6_9MOLU|nr:sensor domain-containing diguanylate cyclase [Xianfuyuplasma coldseepsis]QMS85297.1 diguanylate cyclase [Xianfuyuplasma coldseepsis]
MEKSWKISLLVSFIVLIGSIITSFITFQSYSNILKSSTRSISELSAMNVYSEINNELTKPIYVSLTMSEDTFVKEWLTREDTMTEDEITDYLMGLHNRYGYSSVFLVSTQTQKYYHYNGVQKVVSQSDPHDVWYYDFLDQDNEYDIDVDSDEVTGDLTIFINVKMVDEDDQVTAVVGVGLEMDYITELLQDFEDNYELTVYLTDLEGLVQSSTTINNIEQLNLFDELGSELKNDITSNQEELVTVSKNNGAMYVNSRYIDELHWYLVVTKDTNVLAHFFLDYLYASIIMIVIVLMIVVNIVRLSANLYQNRVFTIAKTDYLTLLLNRRGFDKEMQEFDSSVAEAMIFTIDIDRFKSINDRFGHAVGDVVLRRVANIINNEVQQYGKLSRWGGDEFTGFMIGKRSVVVDILFHVLELINNDDMLQEKGVSISIGYTYSDFTDSLDTVLERADKYLYKAKELGGNQIIGDEDL